MRSEARRPECPADLARLRDAIEHGLTRRQREVLELHFVRGLDQPSIAALLGISQQAVSQHLHGRVRRGRRVGGLLRRLRRLCGEDGPARRGAA